MDDHRHRLSRSYPTTIVTQSWAWSGAQPMASPRLVRLVRTVTLPAPGEVYVAVTVPQPTRHTATARWQRGDRRCPDWPEYVGAGQRGEPLATTESITVRTRSRAAVREPVQRETPWRAQQAVLGRPRGGSAG